MSQTGGENMFTGGPKLAAGGENDCVVVVEVAVLQVHCGSGGRGDSDSLKKFCSVLA